MVWWLLCLSLLAPAHGDWSCTAVDQGQCIINASAKVAGALRFDGNVLVTKHATVQSDASFSIHATGNLTVEVGSSLNARGNLFLNASLVQMFGGSSAVAVGSCSVLVRGTGQRGDLTARALRPEKALARRLREAQDKGRHPDDDGCGLRVHDSSLQGGSLKMDANQSSTCLIGASNITVTNPSETLQILAKSIWADCPNSTLAAAQIVLVAEGDVTLDVAIVGTKSGVKGREDRSSQMDVTTQGSMTLGSQTSSWKLKRLHASAGKLNIAAGSYIQMEGYSTCKHTSDSAGPRDRCFPSWPTQTGSWPASVNDPYVSFDLVLLARSSLTLGNKSMLSAASSLLCVASGELLFMDQNVLDASGRGCRAGTGHAPGNTVRSQQGLELAGGGTHLGEGGEGATWDTHAVLPDKSTVQRPGYDLYNELFLPTEGASGGATGSVSKGEEIDIQASTSSGGGLIWLSALGQGGVTFGGGVALRAEGLSGGVTKHVSGGGAGGQILIFTSRIQTLEDSQPVLSAAGGAGACSSTANLLSGGGGGGFVGLNWSATVPYPAHGVLDVNVAGGVLGNDQSGRNCSWLVPKSDSLSWTYGLPGLRMPLKGCGAGYAGIFCDPCARGYWSPGGLSDCRACDNKPKNGNYSQDAWPDKDCPYTCGVGVPNRKSNPDCLDPMAYALSFFGGPKGVLAIAIAVVTSALWLLWRRRKSGNLSRPLLPLDGAAGSSSCSVRPVSRERASGSRQGESFSTFWASLLCRCCGRRQRLPEGEARTAPPSEFQLTQEQLPFHAGRVYLQGENSGDSPWFLKAHVPPAAESMVIEDRWHQLAQVVNAAADISRFQGRAQALVRYLYPPAAPFLARLFRRRRARAVLEVVRGFPDKERFWIDIRQPGSELFVRFGCNSAATLAYLDFFDFGRSALDWAPVNLRKEAWLIPVHGQGTFDEPYEVDMGDPVLQRLEYHGSTAIFSVLSTFNRIVRRIFKDELQNPDARDDSLQQLHEKVEQCAAQCGMGGFVQVLLIWQKERARGPVAARQRAREAQECSFLDGVETQDMPSERVAPFVHVPRRRELRLCLVFTEFSLLAGGASASDLASPRSDPSPTLACGGSSEALTTPISPQALNEVLRSSATVVGEESANPLPSSSEQICSWGLRRQLLKWGYAGSDQTAARTLVSLICFLAFDLMAFALICGILFQTSMVAGLVWVFVPPLAQPLALVMGILFLVTEDPSLGRLFASLELLGIWNAVVSLLVLIWLLFLDSLVFDILAMAIVSFVKGALFAAAAAHVSQLEADRELSSMDTPQNEFVEGLFSIRGDEEGLRTRSDEARDASISALSLPTIDEISFSATRASASTQVPSAQSIRSSPESFSKPQVQMPSPF